MMRYLILIAFILTLNNQLLNAQEPVCTVFNIPGPGNTNKLSSKSHCHYIPRNIIFFKIHPLKYQLHLKPELR